MATELAALYIKLQAQTDQLQADLKKVESRFEKTAHKADQLAKKTQAIGKELSAKLTLPLLAAGAASIKMASDAEESANKFNVVMGSAADETRAKLEELTATIPLTRAEMEGMAGGIQDMLVPMGVARTQAAGMSADMVQLAGDLASFNNVGTTQVLEAMQSALAGSSEPMRRFGVDTREARLQALALSQGLVAQGEKLDNTSRALAVLAAIQADSTDAMGDAARTVDSTANSFRFLVRDTKELAIQLGQVLIPMIQPLVDQLRDAVERVKGMSDEQRKLAVAFGLAAAAAGPLLVALGSVVGSVLKLSVAIKALHASLGPAGWVILGVGALATAFTAMSSTARDNSAALKEAADGMSELGEAATKATLENLNAALLQAQANLAKLKAEAESTDVTGAMGVQRGAADAEVTAAQRQVDELATLITAASQRWVELGDAAKDANSDIAESTTQAATAEKERSKAVEDALENILEMFALMKRVSNLNGEVVQSIRAGGDALSEAWAADDLAEKTAAEFEKTTEQLRAAQAEMAEAARAEAQQVQDYWIGVAQNIAAAFGDAGMAIADLGGSLVTGNIGGIGSFLMGAVGAVIGGHEEQAQRVEQARDRFAQVLDSYVDTLADMSRADRIQAEAISGAKDVAIAMVDQMLAPIKSDKIREALREQFVGAIENLDLTALQDLLGQFGPEGEAVLAELNRRLGESAQLRQEETDAINAQNEALRKRGGDFADDLRLKGLERSGDSRGALQARMEKWAEEARAKLLEFFEAGVYTQEEFAELSAIIDGELKGALEDFDRSARSAAAAALEAARAEEFRQMTDLKSLEIQLLTAQGRNKEALLMQQQLQLMEAMEKGRSEEYIAKLRELHAQQLVNFESQKQTDAMQRQAQATREATRAADGLAKVLHGPAGLTESLSLYVNRALRGPGDFGVGAATPNFASGGGGSTQVTNHFSLEVAVGPGQDARQAGRDAYDGFVEEYQRRRRSGGINPFAGR